MKIGIMTFHWATNYGAVLQAYCLQEYLREQGHDVEIINYKPKHYDTTWWNFLKHPTNWKRIKKFPIMQRKENLLNKFRKKYLHLTPRFTTISHLRTANIDYDVIISGSDQILNSSFTMAGEGKPTPAYFLHFGRENTKRLGYAVSFGCTQYEERALGIATDWIQRFDAIGVRENTGLDVLKQLAYSKQQLVVPDPTILYGRKFFDDFGIKLEDPKEDYICVYMLRKELKVEGNVRFIDETKEPLSMEQWLTTISHARFFITNSYHGTIMAILAHVPFAVILEEGKASGMNDRFCSMLERLSLKNRIVVQDSKVEEIENMPIDWIAVEKGLASYRDVGSKYLDMLK